jgi:hypothetical protein
LSRQSPIYSSLQEQVHSRQTNPNQFLQTSVVSIIFKGGYTTKSSIAIRVRFAETHVSRSSSSAKAWRRRIGSSIRSCRYGALSPCPLRLVGQAESDETRPRRAAVATPACRRPGPICRARSPKGFPPFHCRSKPSSRRPRLATDTTGPPPNRLFRLVNIPRTIPLS